MSRVTVDSPLGDEAFEENLSPLSSGLPRRAERAVQLLRALEFTDAWYITFFGL